MNCTKHLITKKVKRRSRRKEGWTSWWPLWPINMMPLQHCLSTLVRNYRDQHLSSCLCPLAGVSCRCLLMLEWKRGIQWILENLIVHSWKWQLCTFSIVRTYLIELLSPIPFARYWMLQRWLVLSSLFQVGRRLQVSYFFNWNCSKNCFYKTILSINRWIVKFKFWKHIPMQQDWHNGASFNIWIGLSRQWCHYMTHASV